MENKLNNATKKELSNAVGIVHKVILESLYDQKKVKKNIHKRFGSATYSDEFR